MCVKVGGNFIMIKIYVTDTSCITNKKIFQSIYHQLSSYRKAKIDRLLLTKDKMLSLGAGFLFKKACLDFGIPYEKTKIIFNEHGKPSFDGDVKFKFNISHSGTKAMCVMSEHEVGCDVEQVRKANIKIAKKYFSADEYTFIMSFHTEAEKMDAFYRIWTLKESYIKCTGFGLSLPLKNFSIRFDGADILLQDDRCDDIFSFFEYDYDDGYRYACCVKHIDKQQRFVPQVIRFHILDCV